MTAHSKPIVDAYASAWMRGDMKTARSYLADDLDFKGSIDHFDAADPFVEQLAAFVGMLEKVDMLQAFHDGDRSALLYDCVTKTPAGTIRTAEFFRVKDEKITEIRLVFDATKLRALMSQ